VLLAHGFPVAKILYDGCLLGQYYYAEESLGTVHLGKIFSADCSVDGQISANNFEIFKSLISQYANVQFKISGISVAESPDFATGVHIDILFYESPHLREITLAAFSQAQKRLAPFPLVFSQGDCNPHNLFPGGIIDFDMGFVAPFGYDLLTALYHTYAFPNQGIAEYSRGYLFSEDQYTACLVMLDQISVDSALPRISEYIQDFLIGRIIWSVVNMQDTPRLQKWRFNKYETIVNLYLKGWDFMSIYME
jgi:Phosphotransferase enzyme family